MQISLDNEWSEKFGLQYLNFMSHLHLFLYIKQIRDIVIY